MSLDRLRGNDQNFSDLVVSVSEADQCHDLLLAMREGGPAALHLILAQELIETNFREIRDDLFLETTLLPGNILDGCNQFLIFKKKACFISPVFQFYEVIHETAKHRHAGDYIRTNVLSQPGRVRHLILGAKTLGLQLEINILLFCHELILWLSPQNQERIATALEVESMEEQAELGEGEPG
jgi:hypothetical protein